MFYSNELSFLCDVLEKNRIHATVLREEEQSAAEIGRRINLLGDSAPYLAEVISSLSHRTVYRFEEHSCRYILLRLPEAHPASVLCVGPYLGGEIGEDEIRSIGDKMGITQLKFRYLKEYYTGIAVLDESSPVFLMINSFCERIWRGESFRIESVREEISPSEIPFSDSMADISPRDTMVKIRAIEQRYEFENKMIRAVTLGQHHTERLFKTAFSENLFERRVADPLRNAKNYGIIMNTLLRKAAENGGVHPVHIDSVSSEFAGRIERSTSMEESRELMFEMFRTYCRLVRTMSLRKYSEVVQNTIMIIEADLSAELSPSKLAESQDISLGYLSTLFKKETGSTLSEYIRKRRMEYAEYILSTTNLQIQTVALHCGIMDVQYFSKLFKGHFGKTPSEYRLSIRGEK